MKTEETPLDWALLYSRDYGWPVFPCHTPVNINPNDGKYSCSCGDQDCTSIGKHPRTKNGLKDASLDESQIRAWWERWPDANIGIPTGTTSGIIVVDVDGPTGWDEIATRGGMPGTYSVTTGKEQGHHLYFIQPRGCKVINRSNVLPGVDSRGQGGYVIAPPSLHQFGKRYAVEYDSPIPAECPEWWLELVRVTEEEVRPNLNGHHPVPHLNGSSSYSAYVTMALQNEADAVRNSVAGNRNDQLNTSAFNLGTLIGAGELTEEVAIDELTNAAITAGLGVKEIKATIRSGLKSGMAKPRALPAPGKRLILRAGSARTYIQTGAETVEEEKEDDSHSIPIPYGIEDGRIVFILEKTNRQGETITSYNIVADFAAHTVEEIMAEDGEATYKVEGRSPSGSRFYVELPAKQASDPKALSSALSAAAGAQFPVRAGMEKHLPPALKLLTESFERVNSYTRTGWSDDGFLMPGREKDNVVIHLPRKLPYSIDEESDLEIGTGALRSLILSQRPPMAIVAATVAFLAPMAKLAGLRNERCAVFIAGRTGSLKSSWSQVLMALYGPGYMNDDQLIKWGEGATRNAIMNFATHAHDMPFLIDNYKPTTGGGSRDFINLIHNILEGGEKDRLNRNATLRDSKAVFAWPIITGEDVPDNDAASLARVLVIPFAWKNNETNPELADAQAKAFHLCAIGGAWLDWLEGEESKAYIAQVSARFNDRRGVWAGYLKRQRPDMVNVSRVASNLAANQLTWELMAQCPALKGFCREFESAHRDGLFEVAGSMAVHTAESLEATRYLAAVRELLSTDRCKIVLRGTTIEKDERDRIIGWKGTEDDAYLLSAATRQAVERLLSHSGGLGDISDQTLYKQLDSLGVIIGHDPDRLTKKIKAGGMSERTLHIKMEALEGGNELE